MPTSIQIKLNEYQTYLTKLLKLMKKSDNQVYKERYQYWSTEYSNLMAYALEPRVSDEIYSQLEIY